MLYASNLYNIVHQLYFNKLKKKTDAKRWPSIGIGKFIERLKVK